MIINKKIYFQFVTILAWVVVMFIALPGLPQMGFGTFTVWFAWDRLNSYYAFDSEFYSFILGNTLQIGDDRRFKWFLTDFCFFLSVALLIASL